MRKALIITAAVLLAVALAAPSSGAGRSTSVTDTVGSTEQWYGFMCYQALGTSGWGAEQCRGPTSDGEATAGCSNCVLRGIRITYADSAANHFYRVLVQSGWGHWRVPGEMAGCYNSCVVEMVQIDTFDYYNYIEYRVLHNGKWGDWHRRGEKAGCYNCTLNAIQMREVFLPYG
jgi:hypothetical protein